MMTRIVGILAGGESLRMGGRDKALATLRGARLVDLVLARLAGQADHIVISGREDYGTGLTVIPDNAGPLRGPAAGVFAVGRWVVEHEPSARGFFTSPVDGPFLPNDLLARLGASSAPAIAADDEGLHPTFAYWTLRALADARRTLQDQSSISLRALAADCDAREVRWPGKEHFVNINAPTDLRTAQFQTTNDNTPRRKA